MGMKRLGIIGGVGPESTIAYYRSIIRRGLERSGGWLRRFSSTASTLELSSAWLRAMP
jgi:aspartate/glutamate racemase